ncbi:CBO0543 family protein [Neobacillus niacini]|uniref:CBO0543 family protein n=1 Tax=Neobacillus niacini TaxID=86668 RepID=UPI002FFF8B51
MNTVKRSKGLNLPPWPKKSLPFLIKEFGPTVFLAILLGTCLDLYFVGKNLYMFPKRPFPEIFSFNIGFTFIALPILVLVFINMMNRVTKWGKVGIILFLSLLMPIMERLSELFGLFEHASEWKHIYSFFGYLVFLSLIFVFYRLTNKEH